MGIGAVVESPPETCAFARAFEFQLCAFLNDNAATCVRMIIIIELLVVSCHSELGLFHIGLSINRVIDK